MAFPHGKQNTLDRVPTKEVAAYEVRTDGV